MGALVFLTSEGFFDILDLVSKTKMLFLCEAALTATSLKLRYRSIDQALAHYRQLKTGRIFIPTEMLLPAQTRLRLALVLPDRSRRIAVEAEVLEATDRKTAADLKKVAGMLLGLVGDETAAIQDLERELGIAPVTADGKTPDPPGAARPGDGSPSLPPTEKVGPSAPTLPAGEPAGKSSASATTPQKSLESKQATGSSPELSMDWIRSAVAQAEAAREAQGPDPAAPAGREKKTSPRRSASASSPPAISSWTSPRPCCGPAIMLRTTPGPRMPSAAFMRLSRGACGILRK